MGVIYDLLESIGVTPVMANPLKIRTIAEAKIKTDTIDASTLVSIWALLKNATKAFSPSRTIAKG
jgi:hypothetical protein